MMGSVLILDSSVGLRVGSFAINQCMNDELERFSQFFSLSTSSLPGHRVIARGQSLLALNRCYCYFQLYVDPIARRYPMVLILQEIERHGVPALMSAPISHWSEISIYVNILLCNFKQATSYLDHMIGLLISFSRKYQWLVDYRITSNQTWHVYTAQSCTNLASVLVSKRLLLKSSKFFWCF